MLRNAVEGLRALDYGESQPMFAPSPKKGVHGGTKPYTLRKLRMQALGYADLLIAKKYRGDEPANRTVAGAYGEKTDAFRSWKKRKSLGKTTDPLMKSFREDVAKLDWDENHILDELKAAGAKYQEEKKLAHKFKT